MTKLSAAARSAAVLVVGSWILALGSFVLLAVEYVTVGFEVHPGLLPAVPFVAWLGSWAWAFFFALLPLVLLVFPDGRLLSRRPAFVDSQGSS